MRADDKNIIKVTMLIVYMFTITILLFQVYSIQFSSSVNGCLPFSVSIINKLDKTPQREQLFSYQSHSAEPYFADGVNFHKLAAAVEGDVVTISHDKVIVSNPLTGYEKTYEVNALPMLKYSQIDIEDFNKTISIPKGKIFALGTLKRSFDSRYWGLVDVKYIQGSGYGIF